MCVCVSPPACAFVECVSTRVEQAAAIPLRASLGGGIPYVRPCTSFASFTHSLTHTLAITRPHAGAPRLSTCCTGAATDSYYSTAAEPAQPRRDARRTLCATHRAAPGKVTPMTDLRQRRGFECQLIESVSVDVGKRERESIGVREKERRSGEEWSGGRCMALACMLVRV